MATVRSDRFTEQSRKNELYSDFLTDLTPHPVSGGVMRFVNENAVTRSIKNLLKTNRNERLYQPNIGSDIHKLLFEPMMQSTADTLATSIRETIDKYEPRAKVLNVTVAPDYNGNAYTVNVVYMLINRQEPVSVNITLTRVR